MAAHPNVPSWLCCNVHHSEARHLILKPTAWKCMKYIVLWCYDKVATTLLFEGTGL